MWPELLLQPALSGSLDLLNHQVEHYLLTVQLRLAHPVHHNNQCLQTHPKVALHLRYLHHQADPSIQSLHTDNPQAYRIPVNLNN